MDQRSVGIASWTRSEEEDPWWRAILPGQDGRKELAGVCGLPGTGHGPRHVEGRCAPVSMCADSG